MGEKTWYIVNGSSPTKINKAMRDMRRRGFEIIPCTVGVSFYILLTPESNPSFYESINLIDFQVDKVETNFPLERTGIKQYETRGGNEMSDDPMLAQGNQNVGEEIPGEVSGEMPEELPGELPSDEELLDLRSRHTIEQIGKMFGVPKTIVRWRLRDIPGIKDIQVTYTCSEEGCNRKFSGPNARWQYISHMGYVHRKPERQNKPVKIPQAQDEILSIKTNIAFFDGEIRLAEKRKNRKIKELDQRIEELKSTKQKYVDSILSALATSNEE